eukprot:TRINITY_DN12775_c0_g1_i1.p1 TRINITY_DN12775_c0_g1~~TRINITY_DN12775_c0_g1_i1.p1  ORF type:complete len:462 (-),score=55.27 TRINITY_DN12775_c0_g1_i1:178-1563(-)
MSHIKAGLKNIAQNARDKEEPIIVRIMVGNIIGMPVNCDSLIRELTDHLDEDSANIQLWVGAWRRGVSWNHSKIIAVDGNYLVTGGHNLWDRHYLKRDPVHDLSMEIEGRVSHDGHLYLNDQWRFVQNSQTTIIGRIVSQLPDWMPMLLRSRVAVSQWGVDADTFPPMYEKSLVPYVRSKEGHVPMISMGRYGSLLYSARPADDAFVAMFDAAQEIVHLAIQDLGPICIPGLEHPRAVPGCGWPKPYLKALGRAIWDRDVDVEIALSNPHSIPDGLSPTEALYGNGWSCADVAAEIIKTIPEQFGDVDEGELRSKIEQNLRVCYIKQLQGNRWASSMTMGMHAKHFIIDNTCYYIGSQNLYKADLAEWGVLIDDETQTKKVMQEYWNPMWKASYTGSDVLSSEKVLAVLDVDRDGADPRFVDEDTKQLMDQAHRSSYKVPEDCVHLEAEEEDDDEDEDEEA